VILKIIYIWTFNGSFFVYPFSMDSNKIETSNYSFAILFQYF